jgi:hypothetical protein
MSLQRKGSRAITVDGRRYRWVALYAQVTWCSAACPLRLTVQQDGGRGGQMLLARFARSTGTDEIGQEWVFPRYGAAVTPGVVADIIRAGLTAGWEPQTCGRPPLELDGEPFLRLPPDPTQPPPGSEDDLKRRFLFALREKLAAGCSAPPIAPGDSSAIEQGSPRHDAVEGSRPGEPPPADPARDSDSGSA